MPELFESLLLLDSDDCFFPEEIEDYAVAGSYESSNTLSPPISMNHPSKHAMADFSDAIDANFRKRMENYKRSDTDEPVAPTDLTFAQQQHRHRSKQTSILHKFFTPEQLLFQRRLAARRASKQNNRRINCHFKNNNEMSPPDMEPFICIW